MSDVIRILIADDHPMFREGINLILSGSRDMEVVAESGTAAEAFRLAREHAPDVVLLDISLPDVNGLSALSQIRDVASGARVLVLSMHADSNHVVRAFEMGADGYIAKQSASRTLVQGIREVNAGTRFVDEVTRTALGTMPGFAEETPEDHACAGCDYYERLSTTEQTVLRLLASSEELDRIADELGQTTEQVDSWRETIYEKLGLNSHEELEAFARKSGILEAGSLGGTR
jgi:DNA-binding NarL/FixJ family response regulator